MQRFLDSRLSLRQLRAIEAIDRFGSLSQAAVALGITQSALSKSLHEAEGILQLRVFDRSSRGVVRSRHGDGPVRAAKNILTTLRRLEDELDRSLADSSATVTVGALSTAALGLLPPLLPRMMEHQPSLQVRIVEGLTSDLLVRLASGEIDLVAGRIYEQAEDERFATEKLYDEPLAVIARADHPLFTSDDPDLFEFEAILPTYSQRFGPEIEAFAADVNLHPSHIVRSGSVGLLIEMLLSGDLVTVLPKLMVAGDLRRKTLKVVPVSVQQSKRPGGLIWAADRESSKGAELIAELMRAEIRRLTREETVIQVYAP